MQTLGGAVASLHALAAVPEAAGPDAGVCMRRRPDHPDSSERELPFDAGERLEVEAGRHLAAALGWCFVDLESYSISCGILGKVTAELACRLRCVPIVHNAHRIVLAVDDPFQGAYLELHPELFGSLAGRELSIALATRRGLDRALHKRVTVLRV